MCALANIVYSHNCLSSFFHFIRHHNDYSWFFIRLFCFFPKKKVFLFFVLLFVNRIDTLTRTEIIMMLITKCCLLMIICKCGDKVMLWCLDVATLRDVASWYQSADKYRPFFVRGYAITKSYAVLLCCAKTKITIAHTISGHNNCSSWNRSYCSAALLLLLLLCWYFIFRRAVDVSMLSRWRAVSPSL